MLVFYVMAKTVHSPYGSSTSNAEFNTYSPNQYFWKHGCDLLIIGNFMPVEGMIVFFFFLYLSPLGFGVFTFLASSCGSFHLCLTRKIVYFLKIFSTSPLNNTSLVFDPCVCWCTWINYAEIWLLLKLLVCWEFEPADRFSNSKMYISFQFVCGYIE